MKKEITQDSSSEKIKETTEISVENKKSSKPKRRFRKRKVNKVSEQDTFREKVGASKDTLIMESQSREGVIGHLEVGTIPGLNNSLSSMGGISIIEKDKGFVNISAAFSSIKNATTFEEREQAREFLNRPGYLGKKITAVLPMTLASGKVISTKDELGETMDRLSIANIPTSFGLSPDLIRMNLSLNISGRIPQPHDKKYSAFNVDEGTGTQASINYNKFGILKQTEWAHQNSSNGTFSLNEESSEMGYNEAEGVFEFNKYDGIHNHSYAADISSVVFKNNYKLAFENLVKFYKDNSEFRLHDLVSDSAVFYSLTDSAIQTATFLKIAITSIQEAINNAEIITSKYGILDEGVRYLLTRNKNEKKVFENFIEDVNEFLKVVPHNSEVFSKWKEAANIGKMFADDFDKEGNPLLIPSFTINFEKDNIDAFDGSITQNISLKSNVAQSSTRASFGNLLKALFNAVKFKTKQARSDSPAFPVRHFAGIRQGLLNLGQRMEAGQTISTASISNGYITHFIFNLLRTEFYTGKISQLLKKYILQTYSFWSHLELGKVFEGTIFSKTQVDKFNYSPTITNVGLSKVKHFLTELNLGDADSHVPFYTKDELNDNTKVKTANAISYSKLDKIQVQTHTKFILVTKHLSTVELNSVFLMDSIVFPYVNTHDASVTSLFSNALYGDLMKSGSYTFTHGTNKKLAYSPVSFLWSGVNNFDALKLNFSKFDDKNQKFCQRNKLVNLTKPSNGETVSNSLQSVSTADSTFFWKHYESVTDLQQSKMFNNEFKFHEPIFPKDLSHLWQAPGFSSVIKFENAFIKDMFSARDVTSYYEVPKSNISVKDIKI